MDTPTTPGITGYRALSEEAKGVMNTIKEFENSVGELLQVVGSNPDVDGHMLARAVESLQVGFMLAVRSVARPQSALRLNASV